MPISSDGPAYTLRALAPDELQAVWDGPAKAIFADTLDFPYRERLSPAERDRQDALDARMGDGRYRLALGAFAGAELAGWSVGLQESKETYVMSNSAVLPAHRGRGVYGRLVAATLETVVPLGFQRIYSQHLASNNAVIIPKLRAGFVITGMEVSDQYGTMVRLTYLPNAARREVLDVRTGLRKPDARVRGYLGL